MTAAHTHHELPLETIYIGGLVASQDPMVVRTVLGSCVAVCLRDPYLRIGGMNHFILPMSVGGLARASNYGIHAMELLINECMHLGAYRSRLEAKVFGGGKVLNTGSVGVNVADLNVEFAMNFLRTESIKVVASDVGGFAAREIRFQTDSGRVRLRRYAETGLTPEMRTCIRQALNAPPPETHDNDDNVTLFIEP